MATIANTQGRAWDGPDRRAAVQAIDAERAYERVGVNMVRYGLALIFRMVWPKASAIGSIGAAITFLITLRCMLTTPGV